MQPQNAQLTVSLSCILYLQSSFDFVNPQIADEQTRSSVALCLHELHLYAIDHWVDHLLALSESLGSLPGGHELETLFEGLERLTDMHENLTNSQGFGVRNGGGRDSAHWDHRWQLLGVSPATRSLLDRVLVCRQMASLYDSQPNVPHCE